MEEKKITPRENEVLGLVSQGHTYKEIVEKPGIGSEIVHTHIKRICSKLSVATRTETVAKYCLKIRC